MNQWQDTAVILRVRAHGENGLIISLISEKNGRCVGYVPGGQSRARRMGIEMGAVVDARWSARVLDQMGTFILEPLQQPAQYCLDHPLKLAALTSACALCEEVLPEREAHGPIYHGLVALLAALADDDIWGPAYVAWEISLMKELGFALDLTRCAAGGDASDLCYVSPKSGTAVSREYGALYRSRLLPLPEFLRPQPQDEAVVGTLADVAVGLHMTGFFLENWVFNHHRTGVPEARKTLESRICRILDGAGVQQAAG